MSAMIEVYYAAPADDIREQMIGKVAESFGGKLSYRETPEGDELPRTVCLTYEFVDSTSAQSAADRTAVRTSFQTMNRRRR